MKFLQYIIAITLLVNLIACDSATNITESDNSSNVTQPDDTTVVTTPTDSTKETEPNESDDTSDVTNPNDTTEVTLPNDTTDVASPNDTTEVTLPNDTTDVANPNDTTETTLPSDTTDVEEPANNPTTWRFVVLGDTHVTIDSDTVSEMIPYFLEDDIDLILLCGDIIEGGFKTTATELEAELRVWESIFQPLYDSEIGVYPVRGNHEDDANNDITVWNKIFTGAKLLPQNGPVGEENLTYSFKHKNALFIGLDTYVDIHKINQPWLDAQLDSNDQPHIFPFGHEAAFKVFHDDCLDDFTAERDIFWSSLSEAGAKTYFCGHDHFFDATEIDDGDGNADNNIYQFLVGGGGGWLMPKYRYNGENSTYAVNPIYHEEANGYALVEVSGSSNSDLSVTITWKERFVEGTTISYVATENVITYEVTAK